METHLEYLTFRFLLKDSSLNVKSNNPNEVSSRKIYIKNVVIMK